MRHAVMILISWLFFSCNFIEGKKEGPDQEMGTLNQALAYIGTTDSGSNEYLIYFELKDEINGVQNLIPTALGEICELLQSEFSDFEYESWETCSSNLGLKYMMDIGSQRARLLVNVSGKIFSNNSGLQPDYYPFELTHLEKIKDCPIEWEKEGEEKPLAETSWRFIGFIDKDNEIYSHPACEEENFGINFSNQKVNDSQAYVSSPEFPDALIMKFQSFVWYRASSGTKAYFPISHNQFIPTFGIWSNQFHPGPSNALYTNLHAVPRRMKEKYDSLGYLLSTNDTVDFFINQNILRLSNAKRSLEAIFVAEGKEE